MTDDLYTRNCSDCRKVLSYSSKKALYRAVKDNSACHSCATKGKNNPMHGKNHSEESKQKQSEARRGKKVSEETKQKQSEANSGKNHPNYRKTTSEETKRKISTAQKGKVPWNKGLTGVQIDSEETRRKKRLAAIARIARRVGQMQPNYNPEACRIIEEYGKQYGYNFQHAENGGEFHIKELGYWVDGYDDKQNVVIEIDEFQHYESGKLRKKDVQRQKEITKHLGCEFIRMRV